MSPLLNVPELHDKIVKQDEDLRANLYNLLSAISGPDRSSSRIMIEGIASIHERLGNLMEIMLVK